MAIKPIADSGLSLVIKFCLRNMIIQLDKYIFLYALIRPMYTYHYLNIDLCVLLQYCINLYLIRTLHYRLWLILAYTFT